ncbi:hypothetical protein GJ496_005622 [Pomphorhynchus laevis]|nr:hypothetical protein GJ496_005622 [Pomphorhynchus laevis]
MNSNCSMCCNCIEIPILYGNHVVHCPEDDSMPIGHTHRWSLFFRSTVSKDCEILDYFVESITFRLHNSYSNPVRTLTCSPYEIHETGWGEFDIEITIKFKDLLPDRELTLNYYLRLFSTDESTFKNSQQSKFEIHDSIVFQASDKIKNQDMTEIESLIDRARQLVKSEENFLKNRILYIQGKMEELVSKETEMLSKFMKTNSWRTGGNIAVSCKKKVSTKDSTITSTNDSSEQNTLMHSDVDENLSDESDDNDYEPNIEKTNDTIEPVIYDNDN